jgi:hypothetical protein
MSLRERLGIWLLRPYAAERIAKAKAEVDARGVCKGPEYESGYWMGSFSTLFYLFHLGRR